MNFGFIISEEKNSSIGLSQGRVPDKVVDTSTSSEMSKFNFRAFDQNSQKERFFLLLRQMQ